MVREPIITIERLPVILVDPAMIRLDAQTQRASPVTAESCDAGLDSVQHLQLMLKRHLFCWLPLSAAAIYPPHTSTKTHLKPSVAPTHTPHVERFSRR